MRDDGGLQMRPRHVLRLAKSRAILSPQGSETGAAGAKNRPRKHTSTIQRHEDYVNKKDALCQNRTSDLIIAYRSNTSDTLYH